MFKNPKYSAATALLETLGLGLAPASSAVVKVKKPSKVYPFSSTRQNERTARQASRATAKLEAKNATDLHRVVALASKALAWLNEK